jgi:hypothetical protein
MVAMTPKSLRTRISKLRVKAPITEGYGKAISTRGIWKSKEVWYSSQKEHWMVWLSEYGGPGFYGRKDSSVRTAELVYNRIGNPQMILWLAEAAGIAKRNLLVGKRAALAGPRNRNSHCALIRKAIPWPVIEERLRAK